MQNTVHSHILLMQPIEPTCMHWLRSPRKEECTYINGCNKKSIQSCRSGSDAIGARPKNLGRECTNKLQTPPPSPEFIRTTLDGEGVSTKARRRSIMSIMQPDDRNCTAQCRNAVGWVSMRLLTLFFGCCGLLQSSGQPVGLINVTVFFVLLLLSLFC